MFSKIAAILLLGMAMPLSVSAADPPLHQQIDQLITARDGGPAAELSSDAEFLRRVYLDLAGTIPTADAARKFNANTATDKRIKLIDRLLASPEYARRMQQAVTVMLLERRAGTAINDQQWNDFLNKSFAANTPWDQFVRDLIAADGHDEQTRAAIRFFVDGGRNDHHQMTRDVASIFLGMNIHCAQCHDHPNVADFKQADYFGLYSYLNQSRMQSDKQQKQPFLVETVAVGKFEFLSVFDPDNKKLTGPRLPGGKEIDVPKFEKGQEFAKPAKDGLPGVPKFRPRQLLANDLTSPDNQRFVRNSVNRFWFLMFGRGLVHPLDMLHGDNPPSHPKVLDLLAKEFAARKFNVKDLLREIALTETYQRSSLLPDDADAKVPGPKNYRVARPRPLAAEQVAFSILQATGNLKRYAEAPIPEKSTFSYKDYVNGRIDPPNNLPDLLTLFSSTFGNPPGEAEVDFRPSVKQSLFLMNGRLMMQWLEPHDGNLSDRLSKLTEPGAVTDELYLSILTRLPNDEERTAIAAYFERHKSRREASISELLWSMLTSAEFRLNH